MKIGVFDSGIGGQSIANALKISFPDFDIVCVDDHEHLPYGSKPQDEIIRLTNTAIQPLIGQCGIIVIACNTATTAAIEWLRTEYPAQKFIGIEPMVKPAALMTKTGIIAVCATPYTLGSQRYHELKATYAKNIRVIEPDCSDWAGLIENDRQNEIKIDELVQSLLDQNVDVIVLGCTHYLWIKDTIVKATTGKAVVIEPTSAIASRVRDLL